MNNQKGYIDIDFTALFIFAGIGLLAIALGLPYALYWLFTNFYYCGCMSKSLYTAAESIH